MATYTMTEAARQTAAMVTDARAGREPVLITDHGKVAAALISPELLARYEALEAAADQAVIDEIVARGPQWVPADEANRQMAAILAEADAADQSR